MRGACSEQYWTAGLLDCWTAGLLKGRRVMSCDGICEICAKGYKMCECATEFCLEIVILQCNKLAAFIVILSSKLRFMARGC
jgi:hypothetical protein